FRIRFSKSHWIQKYLMEYSIRKIFKVRNKRWFEKYNFYGVHKEKLGGEEEAVPKCPISQAALFTESCSLHCHQLVLIFTNI
ncbi:hypothetical protein VIGAN_02095000, partial [Vigna angularis var. angularis]